MSSQDPARFTPQPGSHGDIINWGIVEDGDGDGLAVTMQRLILQSSGPLYHATLVPQVQFINFLIKRKVSARNLHNSRV